MKQAKLLVILLFGLILLGGCAKEESQAKQTINNEPTANPTATKEVVIEGSEFKFEPATITATKGEQVKIKFKNVGTTGHNLAIKEIGKSTSTISPGSTDELEFVAEETGTLTFYCSVGSHRQAGMEGQITIE